MTDTVCQKGQQMNIRHLAPDDPVYHQCLYAYDVLLVNDKVLTNRPLRERLEVLRKIINPVTNRVQISQVDIKRTGADISEALFAAIDRFSTYLWPYFGVLTNLTTSHYRREEGIMLKDPESVYKPNARSGGGWLKIKPEYNNDLMDQCDLIVMGGYYGKGKRAGVTHFLLGALDPTQGQDHPLVRSVARVGSGYSVKELFELMQKVGKKN